jgi:acyl dehydratase
MALPSKEARMATATDAADQTVVAFLDEGDGSEVANPIHADGFAREHGFRGPLVGGVTVWGWATQAILDAAGPAWLDRGWSEIVFRQPTFPGDRVEIRVRAQTGQGKDRFAVRMTNQDGVDCVVATLGLGNAPWLGELTASSRLAPGPAPDPKPQLLLDRAPIGQDLVPMSVSGSAEDARAYVRRSQPADDRRFAGDRPRLHPGWIAGRPEDLLRHNFEIPASMHIRSRLQHLAPAVAGGRIAVAAKCVEAYERKGHHVGVFDCLVLDEGGVRLAHIRHTTIFRIATPGGG